MLWLIMHYLMNYARVQWLVMLSNFFLLRMIDMGTSPTIVTCSSMFRGYVSRLTDVRDLLNEMTNSTISSDVINFSILIYSYCKEWKVKQAKDVLGIMLIHGLFNEDRFANEDTMLNGFCKNGDTDESSFITTCDRRERSQSCDKNKLLKVTCGISVNFL